MGRDKALLPWPKDAPTPGATILSCAINALSNFCDFVSVVAGKNENALRPVVYGLGAFLVRNPAPDRGQFSSLQAGLRDVLNRGRDSAMVALVDRPPASPQSFTALVNAFVARPHSIWAVIPEYQGKHGHPIVIGREMIEAFLTALATSNARDIEHEHQSRILYLPVDDPLVTTNADTPQEFASLQSTS
jgi:molybdenum cofactor cytidylyltransferase